MKTNIIATLGPSSHSKEIITQLVDAGMDMARLNFSWGTHEDMLTLITTVQAVGQEKGIVIPIIADLSGPRISLGGSHSMDESGEVITEKDKDDLSFALKHGVTHVALSFVESATDIADLRQFMETQGKSVPVIAKIERKEALDNLEAICDASDGVMVARGDLGKAVPFEQLPFIEKRILSLCETKGKFVIVATEMMLSMTEAERPTRAEVTDVATAVSLGANAVMLSEETSLGKHPVETVASMRKIISFAEQEKQEGVII